jgi:uncharacterized protein (DUF983 family)
MAAQATSKKLKKPKSTAQPTFPTMFRRGIVGRCPLCGGKRAWFTGWFARAEHCHTCGFRWARKTDGFMTGSMTINIIITFATIAITLLTVTALTYPNLPVLPFMISLIAVGVLLPLLIHPSTCTMWSAVDLAMRPLEADDVSHIDPRYLGR